jgi:DNA helicase HerA-like ATPase
MQQDENTIGRVVSVSGSQLICLLDGPAAQAASGPVEIEVGTIVRMRTQHSVAFAMVRAITIPIPSAMSTEEELKIAELELLGEILEEQNHQPGAFQRGVSFFPRLGNEVAFATQDDLQQIYACPAISSACIGALHHDRSLPAFVKTDDLLGKHFAVLGTTGSGKSCAVTVILKSLLRENPHARVLLLDPHNEYTQAFGDQAMVLDPAVTLDLPHWLFNFDELCEVFIGNDEARQAQATILAEAIVAAKQIFLKGKNEYRVTVDTPTPYSVNDVISYIREEQGKLVRPEPAPVYARLMARLRMLSTDSRYSFMFSRYGDDRMATILSRLFRIPVDGKPITIADLSGVPSETLNVVVSVLCRIALDFALWSQRSSPILVVCEEAHRYAPRATGLGFEPTKRALARIAKEGRKYGVSLCVISQRPSDLATDMLSECNTMFALRMSNQADQELVQATMAEAGLGLLEFLPSLHTGEAIVIGEGVPVPQRVIFSPLAAHDMPRSKTFVFSEAWSQDSGTAEPVASIVERWRHLQKGSTRQQTRREPGPRAQAAAAAANAQGTMQPAATLQMPPQTQRPTGT